MKKLTRILSSIGTCALAWMLFCMPVLAEASVYTNGIIFDADFYAATYPDAVSKVGNKDAKLAEHYTNIGMAEGKLPYAGYGTGVSPITGAKDIALAGTGVFSINPNAPELVRYQKEALQKVWADKGYERYYGVGLAQMGFQMTYRMIKYFPYPAFGSGNYVIPAEMLQDPDLGGWYIAKSENGSTWEIHCIKHFNINPNGGYCMPKESWDALRNVLRYMTPDAETIFRNVVSLYYNGVAPVCPDYGNFYNVGSTLFMVQDPFGEVSHFRPNDGNLNMAALHKTIPSATAPVPVSPVKRTSIDANDPALRAYKAAYDAVANYAKSGMTKFDPENLDTYDIEKDGTLLLMDTDIASVPIYGSDDIWCLGFDAGNLRYAGLGLPGGCWGLDIRGWVTELECDAIRQALHHVTPDAEALYAKIMENEVKGNLKRNTWISVGSSRLYVYRFGTDDYGQNFFIYFFK